MGSIKWPKDQEGRSHSKMLTAVIGTIITLTMVVGLFVRESVIMKNRIIVNVTFEHKYQFNSLDQVNQYKG